MKAKMKNSFTQICPIIVCFAILAPLLVSSCGTKPGCPSPALSGSMVIKGKNALDKMGTIQNDCTKNAEMGEARNSIAELKSYLEQLCKAECYPEESICKETKSASPTPEQILKIIDEQIAKCK